MVLRTPVQYYNTIVNTELTPTQFNMKALILTEPTNLVIYTTKLPFLFQLYVLIFQAFIPKENTWITATAATLFCLVEGQILQNAKLI